MMNADAIRKILRNNIGKMRISADALDAMLKNLEYETKVVTSDYLAFLKGRIDTSDGAIRSDTEKRLKGLSPFVGEEYVAVLLRDKSAQIALSVGIRVKTNDVLYVISTN